MISRVFLVICSLVGIGLAHSRERNDVLANFVFPMERTNSNVGGRIIGGREAQPHAYPYQVGLYCHGNTTNFCGGSLISGNYVLTAAHCVENITSADLIFGAHAIEDKEEVTQVRQSSNQFIIHPEWDKGQLINDIALVKLSEPVKETEYIQIIKITNAETDTFAGDQGIIAGWGRTTNNQQGVSPTLRYLESDIMSNEDCKSIDPYETVILPTHLCLFGQQKDINVGTCNGDSGGPLAVDGTQVGLVSFGYSDCEAGKPSVFTRLTEFRDWIIDNSDIAL